jgi:hypothetical protein
MASTFEGGHVDYGSGAPVHDDHALPGGRARFGDARNALR